MNAATTVSSWPTLWTLIGSLIVAALTIATIAGIKLPVITTDRAVVLVLVVLGFIMCSIGGSGRVIGQYGITHPISIIGSILGVLTLLVAASVLFGFKLPLIESDRAAVYVVAGIILSKLVINGAFYYLTR